MPQPAAGGGRCFRATNRRAPCKTQSPASTAMLPRNVWTTSFRPTRRNTHILQTKPQNRWFSLHRAAKIVLRNNPVLDRPDHESHVAGQVPEVVFAGVAFLEFLEMHEGVVPGVEEEILLPALPVVRSVPG